MTGHQRWFVNKFQKYHLTTDHIERMEKIKAEEKKEAMRIKAGWSVETYASVDK